MKVHICGCRGSTPAPGAAFVRYGGHTSCVAVGVGDEFPSLVLDSGTGLRNLDRLLGGVAFEGSILLGHLHWDHTLGLPFFRSGDRDESRVDLYLPAQEADAEAVLERVMSPPHFPIKPAQLRGRWRFISIDEDTHEIGPFQVLACEIPHKGGKTFGFRIEHGGRSIAFLSDHAPDVLGGGRNGFGVSHDGAIELAEDVDLLIHDAQFLDDEWQVAARLGHSTVGYAVQLAQDAGARRLLLYHHDPSRTDGALDELSREMGNHAPLRVEVAREGQVIDVGRTESG